MTYEDRVKLYNKIEEVRGRPLITYITSSRLNASGNMAADVIPEFCKQIINIPKEKTEVDLLLVSNGGDPVVSWRIISLLRERFKKVGVLLPYQAYSAATLVALGADDIVMHPFSNLGPVDPQLSGQRNVPGKPGMQEQINFGAEDLSHFIDFVCKDVGITDQEQKERAFELVCKEVGAIPIGIAKRSSNLASSLGQKLLSLHMTDQNKVKAISDSLNKSFYHHGYPVGRSEAKSIGLPIIETPPDNLENLMWNVWEDMQKDMKCDAPFNPLEVVMTDPVLSQQICSIPHIEMPANLPPEMANQVFQQIMQRVKVTIVNPVESELYQAAVESNRMRSEFKTKLKITAIRMPDMNININVAPISSSWRTINQT
jgi:hypothetical protein